MLFSIGSGEFIDLTANARIDLLPWLKMFGGSSLLIGLVLMLSYL